MRLLRALREVARIAWRAFNRFQEHGGPDRAATISYYTLLSLLPMLIFLISVGVVFLGSFDRAYANTLFLVKGVVVPLDHVALETLHDFVARATRFQVPGLVLLAWTSRRIFATLISALERVFGTPKRNFARHNLTALLLVFGCGMALLLSMAVTMIVSAAEGLLERFEAVGAFNFVVGVVLYRLVPMLVTFGFFYLLYRLVPRRQVPTSLCLFGALLATTLWELAKKAFSYYVRNLTRFAHVYGALEGVIVLAIWLELSASIILYCGEVIAVMTEPPRQQRRIAFEPPPDTPV